MFYSLVLKLLSTRLFSVSHGWILYRLSALAAVRLKDNNPNITDLSDPNRPLKVGEKLTRLYDDEWTDAIEALEDEKVTELDGIKILLELLTVSEI